MKPSLLALLIGFLGLTYPEKGSGAETIPFNSGNRVSRPKVQSDDQNNIENAPLILRFTGGPNFLAGAKTRVKDSTGSLIRTTETDGNSSGTFGIELEPNTKSFYGIGLEVSKTEYTYQTENPSTDSHVSILIHPKVYLGGGKFRAWLSSGAGISLLSPGITDETIDGVRYVINGSVIALALNPKLAIEFEIGLGVRINTHIGYFLTTPSLDMSITSGAATENLTFDITRSWAHAGLSLILPF
jgi:hypothetical protein